MSSGVDFKLLHASELNSGVKMSDHPKSVELPFLSAKLRGAPNVCCPIELGSMETATVYHRLHGNGYFRS